MDVLRFTDPKTGHLHGIPCNWRATENAVSSRSPSRERWRTCGRSRQSGEQIGPSLSFRNSRSKWRSYICRSNFISDLPLILS